MPESNRRGLTTVEVQARRDRYGWNELPDTAQTSPYVILARQFSSFLIAILLVAALVAMLLGEWVDASAIGLVIGLNAVLGFAQEWRAERALDALRTMLSPKAIAVRDGAETVILARDLVPDDLIVLQAGDTVPADATLSESVGLSVDESILTGESLPIDKGPDALQVFTGTAVVAGRAEAVVTATGAQTEFGKIADLTGAVALKKTHLQQQLGHLAAQLGMAAMAIAVSIAALGILLGRNANEMLMTGLSLAVAIVPEGLPAVVTITLALGAAAMVRRRALPRRLQAVETLGAASVICTDKTGTLTENRMTATKIWTPTKAYEVTGSGYDPAGHIETGGQRVRSKDDAELAAILRAALVCNHAQLTRNGEKWEPTGSPTEVALVTLAYKGWHPQPDDTSVLAERPFNSDRKRMSVLFNGRNGVSAEPVLLTKGAPESVLSISTKIRDNDVARPMNEDDREKIDAAYHAMAEDGLRVIAFCERSMAGLEIDESEMTFLGLVGLIDPPRAEVQAAVAAARSARIRVLMITGDSPVTARAIATQVGLTAHTTITGDELKALGDNDLDQLLKTDVLFARTRPEDKLRIVSALQRDNQIVAMTGDGVNDAPALKQSDIGIAMGTRGTDVAREAADLVLLDDNFATIVGAISEGRRQFSNIRKFVRYLLSSNAGEVVALVVNIAIGGPLVFLATQILWMNLVTDGVTAVALGLEKAEPDHMHRPPRRKSDQILGLGGIGIIVLFGLYTGLASLWIFFALLDQGVDLARTVAFTAMVSFEKISVFAFRALHLPNWRVGWFSNPLLLLALAVTMSAQAAAVYWPPLQTLLHTVPIGLEHWRLIGAFVLPLLLVPEIVKTSHYLMSRPANGRDVEIDPAQ